MTVLVLYHHAPLSPGVMADCCNSPRGKEPVGWWANESSAHHSQQVLSRSQCLQPTGWRWNISLTSRASLLPCWVLCRQMPTPGVKVQAAVEGLLKGLGGVKTTVQRSALQIDSFKGMKVTMAGHIPGGASRSSQT